MPGFQVFYCRHRTGDGIASHAPAPMKVERIAALADVVLEENGDFLGVVDDDDRVLQFIYIARRERDPWPIRMEMPDMCRGQSVIRHLSNADVFDLLRSLPEKITADVVSRASAIP